jgi:hypothetical protein
VHFFLEPSHCLFGLLASRDLFRAFTVGVILHPRRLSPFVDRASDLLAAPGLVAGGPLLPFSVCMCEFVMRTAASGLILQIAAHQREISTSFSFVLSCVAVVIAIGEFCCIRMLGFAEVVDLHDEGATFSS